MSPETVLLISVTFPASVPLDLLFPLPEILFLQISLKLAQSHPLRNEGITSGLQRMFAQGCWHCKIPGGAVHIECNVNGASQELSNMATPFSLTT